MKSETRQCQNCKQDFTIEPEDFEFYEKIKVPPPTWCPECRLIRRILWRNDRMLYKVPDAKTGKLIFSAIPPSAPVKIMDRDYWWSDKFEASIYGREYDFSRPFFEQLKDLLREVPFPSRSISNVINSDYCANANDLKNCYLLFGAAYDENCYYGLNISYSQDCFDSAYLVECQAVYEGCFNQKCYNCSFSSFCESCYDILFCKNCIGCSNCFGSINLRNKQYCWFNDQLTKEEYDRKLQGLNLGSYQSLENLKNQVSRHRLAYPVKFFSGTHNVDVSGEYISNSKNVHFSYHITGGENLKYCQSLYFSSAKDSYDHFRFGNNSEQIYESAICGLNSSRLSFCYDCYSGCSDMEYSLMCRFSSNLFGCIGIKSKKYCILNKQYTEDEYKTLILKVKKHMEEMPYVDPIGRIYKYGEFFPSNLSPFAYNETIAQEYFPLDKVLAESKGYGWNAIEHKELVVSVQSQDLPDHISNSNETILREVIGCLHKGRCEHQCSSGFKIVPQEFQFYKKIGLSLPRLCPNCRHHERLRQRNPMKSWKRGCSCAGEKSKGSVYVNTVKHFHGDGSCPNTFQTSYAPDRPEIVYCEKCYQAEVV